MPTYQYVCTECGTPLEVVQSFADEALVECPTCGGRLRKVFSAVGVVFKGSGFYRNDSRSEKSTVGASAKSADSKSSADAKSSGDATSSSDTKSSSDAKGSSGGDGGGAKSTGSSGSSGSTTTSTSSSGSSSGSSGSTGTKQS